MQQRAFAVVYQTQYLLALHVVFHALEQEFSAVKVPPAYCIMQCCALVEFRGLTQFLGKLARNHIYCLQSLYEVVTI